MIKRYRSHPHKAITVADVGREGLYLDKSAAELNAIAHALRKITSLPQGEGRAALLKLLAEHKPLDLIDDCKTRLTKLRLKIKHHRETDRE